MVALKINGEHVAPNRMDLNRYVSSGLFGSLGSLSQKKRVASRSSLSSPMFKKAFSMSVVHAYLFSRKRRSIDEMSFSSGGVSCRQSFRLGLLLYDLQLQSNTIRIGVVDESFLTGWCGI